MTYAWTPGGATTSSITVSPDGDDDVLGHGDRWRRCDADRVGDDHGESGAVVLGFACFADDPSGTPVTLTANCTGGTPADTYSWSPGGATTPSITVSPTVTTTYTVTVTDATGATSDRFVDDHDHDRD